MRYLALGSTRDIGASCHYLNLAGTGLVLDAGVDPEEEGWESLPAFGLLQHRSDRPVDHVVVSHAHHDHLGGLPVLLKQHPHAGLHLTKATAMLAEVLLPASARLQRRKMMEGSTTASPLFDRETAEAVAYLWEVHDLDEPFGLRGPHGTAPVTGRFYHAGHILGAVGVLLETERDGAPWRLFYTGDVHLRNQAIIPGADFPAPGVDVLLLDSTTGADEEAEQTTRKEQENKLGEAISRTIARGGSALIPAFALGRAQETLALIDRYKRRGLVPDETPVYTTGQMRAVADLYDRTRYTTPRLDEDFEVFGVQQKRHPRSDEALQELLKTPGIHVASSGMLFERTLSNKLAQLLVEDERNGIFFVGFAKEHSPGARLLEAAEAGKGTEVVLDATNGARAQKVNAEVVRFRFSGHAHRRDLVQVVEKVRPKKVVLVHGETEAKVWLRDAIRHVYPGTEVVLPEQGEEIAL